MDATTNPQPKIARISPGQNLVIRPGSKPGDLLLCHSTGKSGENQAENTQDDVKLTTLIVMSGDPTLPTHPLYALRAAVGAYLETVSRGRSLGPLWKEPVTSPTPPRIASVNDMGFDVPGKGR